MNGSGGSQPLLGWFPEEVKQIEEASVAPTVVSVVPAFSIAGEDAGPGETTVDAGRPTSSQAAKVRKMAAESSLEQLCEEQRKALQAGHQRVVALQEEVTQVKMKALKKLREQDTAQHALQLRVHMLEAEKAGLQREQISKMGTPAGSASGTQAPNLESVATPGMAGAGVDGRRVPMLQEKVKQQAAELLRQRAACEAAGHDVRRLQERVDSLQQARLDAEAEAEQLRADLRLAKRASAAPQSVAPENADILLLREELSESEVALKRTSAERDTALEQVELQAKEVTREREASAASVKQLAEVARDAEAEAKSVRAQLASVRQKARELLEQKDAEVAALQLQLRRMHSQDERLKEGPTGDEVTGVPTGLDAHAEERGPRAGDGRAATGRESRVNGGPAKAPGDGRDSGTEPQPPPVSGAAEPSSADVNALHQYAAMQARLESELQQERTERQLAQRQLREATAALGQRQRNAVLQACVSLVVPWHEPHAHACRPGRVRAC